MQDTRIDAEQSHQVLEKGFSQLAKIDNEGLFLWNGGVSTRISTELAKIGVSTRFFFHDQLTDARKEIAIQNRIEE